MTSTPTVAHRVADWPPRCTPAGNAGDSIATRMRLSTTSPSKSRSTAMEAIAAAKDTFGVSRVSAYARASSPARAGTTFVIMNPMAVGRHSTPKGRSGAMGSRIGFQRLARNGNTAVAVADDAAHSRRFDPRSVLHTSPKAIPENAQYSRAMLSTMPNAPRQSIFIGALAAHWSQRGYADADRSSRSYNSASASGVGTGLPRSTSLSARARARADSPR